MTKIFENIYSYGHALGRNMNPVALASCNVFAFKDGPDIDLIDAGILRFNVVQKVWQGMLKDGLDPRNIRAIYHTHVHFDHVQADVFFQKKAVRHKGTLPIYVPRPDLFRMQPNYSAINSNFDEVHRHFPTYNMANMKKIRFQAKYLFEPLIHYQPPQNIQVLEDQTRYTIGKHQATVYTTGGHTEGHSFFHFNDENNFLLTGDHDAINEFTCNWKKTLNSVRLAEKLQPDNVGIGHNTLKLGNKKAMGFITSYFTQFDKIFGSLIRHFKLGKVINLTHLLKTMLGWLFKFSLAQLKGHMEVYVICRYFEDLKLGTLEFTPTNEMIFTITRDPEDIDLNNLIRYGEGKR